jgi:hypothetical protein
LPMPEANMVFGCAKTGIDELAVPRRKMESV